MNGRLTRALALGAAVWVLSTCTPLPSPTSSPPPAPHAPQPTQPPATHIPPPTHTPAPSPTLWTCQESRGRVDRTTLPAQPARRPLQVRIYYPPCYTAASDDRYPFLIMIHGQTYNDDQWDRLGLDEAADTLILAGESRPFLIFMPLEENTDIDPEQANFDQVVAETLLPWIEANFPVCSERACRAVGGLSRGATWAVHLGFLRPELFGSIGAHSLTPFYGDVYRLPYWLMRVELEALPRFYLDMGEDDWFMEALTQFRQAMDRHSVPYEWHLNPGRHEEAYWASHVMDYVRWYASGWPPAE